MFGHRLRGATGPFLLLLFLPGLCLPGLLLPGVLCGVAAAGQAQASQNKAPSATVQSVTIERHTLPVLVGAPLSPLAHLKLEVTGPPGSTAQLTSLVAEIHSGSGSFENLQVFSTGDRNRLSTAANPDAFFGAELFSKPMPADGKVVFEGSLGLAPGVHNLWLASVVRSDADIDQPVLASIRSVEVADPEKRSIVPGATSSSGHQRMGVALRKQGDDGSPHLPHSRPGRDGTRHPDRRLRHPTPQQLRSASRRRRRHVQKHRWRQELGADEDHHGYESRGHRWQRRPEVEMGRDRRSLDPG